MARTNAAFASRTMNAAQRMQYNVQLAKRSALFYLKTISAFMERLGVEAEFTSLGLSIADVRELFGVWNTAWPTVVQLRNLAAQLEHRGADPKPSLDQELLRGIAELCKAASGIADPHHAVKFIQAHHKALLDTLTEYADNGALWKSFQHRRAQEMNALASKLR